MELAGVGDLGVEVGTLVTAPAWKHRLEEAEVGGEGWITRAPGQRPSPGFIGEDMEERQVGL